MSYVRNFLTVRHVHVNHTTIKSWTPARTCTEQVTVRSKATLITVTQRTHTEFILQVNRCIVNVSKFYVLANFDTKTLSTSLTTLCFDYNRTVGTTRTEKCSCSSTLQYLYTFVVGSIQVLQLRTPVCTTISIYYTFLKNHTINNPDRRVILGYRLSTTDSNGRR